MSFMPHYSVQQQPLTARGYGGGAYGGAFGALCGYGGYQNLYGAQGLTRSSSNSGRYFGQQAAAQQQWGASQILPTLYLGAYEDAMNVQQLQALGITAVLNVANDCPPPAGQYQQAGIRHLHLRIEDCDDVQIGSYVAQGVPFMNQAITGGQKVLVHCRYGVSRSTMMVIAYLMKHGSDGFSQMSFSQAHQTVITRRPIINPNPGFIRQLQMMSSQGANTYGQQFGGFGGAGMNYSSAATPRAYGSNWGPSAVRARTPQGAPSGSTSFASSLQAASGMSTSFNNWQQTPAAYGGFNGGFRRPSFSGFAY